MYSMSIIYNLLQTSILKHFVNYYITKYYDLYDTFGFRYNMYWKHIRTQTAFLNFTNITIFLYYSYPLAFKSPYNHINNNKHYTLSTLFVFLFK